MHVKNKTKKQVVLLISFADSLLALQFRGKPVFKSVLLHFGLQSLFTANSYEWHLIVLLKCINLIHPGLVQYT